MHQQFKCTSCGAVTIGSPVRINTLNYCEDCVKKEGIKPEK
jgi:hypothetical protein